jgi:predicted aspartyl protease
MARQPHLIAMLRNLLSAVAVCLASAVLSAPGCATPTETSATELDGAVYASRTTRDQIGRILAPVMINGEGPFRFVVDTGATHSVVSSHLVTRLGLVASADRSILVSGVTGAAHMASVRIDHLQAGSLYFEDREMPVISAVLPGADGILGVEGLADKSIVVDFARDRIRILSSKYYARGMLSVPVSLDFRQLLLATGEIGGVSVKAIIDTGAQRTIGNLALRDALYARASQLESAALVGVQGVTADVQTAELLAAPRVTLGELRLERVAISYGDLHVFGVWDLRDEPALLLGMDVLGVFDRVVFDYAASQVHFKPRVSGVSIRKVR